MSQYKDPYYPTGIMESRRVFFVAHLESSDRITPIYKPFTVGHLEGVQFHPRNWGLINYGY